MNSLTKLFPLTVAVILLGGCLGISRQPELEACENDLESKLLLDAELPEGWEQAQGSPHRDDELSFGVSSNCFAGFFHYNGIAGVANQHIVHYPTEDSAAAGYDRMLGYRFKTRDQPLPARSLPAFQAAQHFAACAPQDDPPMCRFIAQYGTYVVVFNTHMSSRFMTQDEFIEVLQAVDDKLADP